MIIIIVQLQAEPSSFLRRIPRHCYLLLILSRLYCSVARSQKPSAGVFASARALPAVDGHVHKNVRRLHARQEVARVRQFPDAHRTRGSARVGIRLFHNRSRRREPGEV